MQPKDVFINVHYDDNCNVTYFEKTDSQAFTDIIPQNAWDLYEKAANDIARLVNQE